MGIVDKYILNCKNKGGSRIHLNLEILGAEPKSKYLESYAKKMRLGFSKFVTILLTIMLISIHMLNNQTLRIPKW